MNATFQKNTFGNLLAALAKQSGEEKLRIAFKLSAFARELRAQGEKYDKHQQRSRAGTAA